MQLQGIATILVRDRQTLAIKRTITQKNTICKLAVEKLLMDNESVFSSTCKIAISTDQYSADYERTSVSNIIAIGEDSLGGVAGYNVNEPVGNDPRNGVYHNRFLFPSAPRSFSTIAITPSGSSNNNLANITQDIYAYLSLQSPLTQETNEVIDIFYKVYLDFTSPLTELVVALQEGLSQLFLSVADKLEIGYQANKLRPTIISPSNLNQDLRSNIVKGSSSRGEDFSSTLEKNISLLKRRYTITANADIKTNQHLFGIGYGRLDPMYSSSNAFSYNYKEVGGNRRLNLGSSLTPVYSNSANSKALLRDPNTLANSTWQPVPTTDDTFAGLPTIYSLEVENSGGEGIGTYSLYTTNYSGQADYFSGLSSSVTYSDIPTHWGQHPTALVLTANYTGAVAADWQPINDKWFYNWSDDTLWVSGDLTTIALWRIFPELNLVDQWDLSAQGVVTINDLAVDPDTDKIYAATEQGLYMIDVTADTVTQLNADQAKAVDVGFGGAVFAVLVNGTTDRLASSLNASWADVCDTTGTPSDLDWSRVIFIRCDRTSIDYQLGIMEYRVDPLAALTLTNHNNSWYTRVHWWDDTNKYDSTSESLVKNSTNSAYYHPSLSHPYNSSFVVKDGFWVYTGTARTATKDTGNRIPGQNINFVRKLVSANANNGAFKQLVNGDYVYDVDNNTSLATLSLFDIQVCNFGQKINIANSSAPTQLTSIEPAFSILNTDISNGFLPLCVSGFQGNRNGSSYNSSYADNAVGIKEVGVDPGGNTISTIRGYKDTSSIQKYIFSGVKFSNFQMEPEICLSGNIASLRSGGVINLTAGRVARDIGSETYMRGFYRNTGSAQEYSYAYTPIMFSTWGTPYHDDRKSPSFARRWGWNNGNSTWQESETLPGKPLHTASESLINGLSIAWNDLDPGGSVDLISGQFYNFVDLPQSQGFVSDGTVGEFDFSYSYYLRPVAENNNVTGTVPASPYDYFLPEATTDPEWLTLDPEDFSQVKITIAGYGVEAEIITTGIPGANQILLVDALTGHIRFAATDTGKAIGGVYNYCQKIHSTEVY